MNKEIYENLKIKFFNEFLAAHYIAKTLLNQITLLMKQRENSIQILGREFIF